MSDLLSALVSSKILSLESLNSRMVCLHLAVRFSMKSLKYSLSFRKPMLSSYFLNMDLRWWYVSGRISRINGGLFFKFIRLLAHKVTTLSMSFHAFSIDFLSIASFCFCLAAAAAWILPLRSSIHLDTPLVAITNLF